jgi:hydrogenase nickel incorporation protein HypA/HybF
MHEMGIANSVLDAIRQEAAKYPGARASRVGLRIGEWSGVDVESLRFCFEALIAGSDLSGLDVEIDYRLRKNRCSRCGVEFAIHNYEIRCPECDCDDTLAVSGAELDIGYVELEDMV